MERRGLGSTGLQVSVVGIGTWQSYDVGNPAEVQPATDAAVTAGATFFDTSPVYGGAERALGQTLGRRRSAVVVATKVAAPSAEEGRQQIAHSLELYGGIVDLFQIQNLEAWETHLPHLESLKAQGKIRALGITHFLASQFDRMAKIIESGKVSAIQVPYNPHEREVESTLLPLAAERGVGVIVMRPFGQGALVYATPHEHELAFLEQHGLRTWSQALLNWVVSDPRVSVVIPATRKLPHIAENLAVGAAKRFDAETRDRVAKLAVRL
jgi:aryl-alcohol dehydrogenase-like predicted oxidoreductase